MKQLVKEIAQPMFPAIRVSLLIPLSELPENSKGREASIGRSPFS
jgi:hypothetical protein